MTATSGALTSRARERRCRPAASRRSARVEVLGDVDARDRRGASSTRAGASRAQRGPQRGLRRERVPQDRQLRRVVVAGERLELPPTARTAGPPWRRARASSSGVTHGWSHATATTGPRSSAVTRPHSGWTAARARSTPARRAAAAPSTASPPRRVSNPAARAAASGPRDQRLPAELDQRLRCRPCGCRGRPRAPRRSRADGVRAQQLAQLDLQLQRRERRRQPLVGARRARVAPGALVDHQQHLRVARQRIGAQRARRCSAAPRITRSGRHVARRRRARAALAVSLHVHAPAQRDAARSRACSASTPASSTRERRAAAAASRIPSIAAPTSGACAAAACVRGGDRLRQRAGRVDRPPRAAVIRSPQRREAPVRRLVERLRDHAVEARRAAPGARATASAAPRTGARR